MKHLVVTFCGIGTLLFASFANAEIKQVKLSELRFIVGGDSCSCKNKPVDCNTDGDTICNEEPNEWIDGVQCKFIGQTVYGYSAAKKDIKCSSADKEKSCTESNGSSHCRIKYTYGCTPGQITIYGHPPGTTQDVPLGVVGICQRIEIGEPVPMGTYKTASGTDCQ
jgi:hypothetical protein